MDIQLSAARGEYESFQIVTRAPNGVDLSNVNLSITDLAGHDGQVIGASNIALYREYYVYVDAPKGSPDWGGANRPLGPGWYPDGLIPIVNYTGASHLPGSLLAAMPYSLTGGTNQPIWVDVFVPRTAAAGVYSGQFTVTCDQGVFSGQILLNVWNFTLPLQPSLLSSFGVWATARNSIDVELLRNRLMPEGVHVSDQATLMHAYGLGVADLGFSSGAEYGKCRMLPPPEVVTVQRSAAAQQPGLGLYNYTADEVDDCTNLFPMMKQWAQVLHAAGVKNLITMGPVAPLFDDGSGTGASTVDIWVVLPETFDTHLGNVQAALRKGDQVWSYNTEVQDAYSPKWEIDFAPINFRIQPGFINQSLDLTGLLYWRVDRWSSDPWNDISFKDGSSNFPGDGQLVYPGSSIGIYGVAPSMRLKWLRDGVEDYDYIQLLKQAGYKSWALQVAQSVGSDWKGWTRDPDALEAARLKLGTMLSSLGN